MDRGLRNTARSGFHNTVADCSPVGLSVSIVSLYSPFSLRSWVSTSVTLVEEPRLSLPSFFSHCWRAFKWRMNIHREALALHHLLAWKKIKTLKERANRKLTCIQMFYNNTHIPHATSQRHSTEQVESLIQDVRSSRGGWSPASQGIVSQHFWYVCHCVKVCKSSSEPEQEAGNPEPWPYRWPQPGDGPGEREQPVWAVGPPSIGIGWNGNNSHQLWLKGTQFPAFQCSVHFWSRVQWCIAP